MAWELGLSEHREKVSFGSRLFFSHEAPQRGNRYSKWKKCFTVNVLTMEHVKLLQIQKILNKWIFIWMWWEFFLVAEILSVLIYCKLYFFLNNILKILIFLLQANVYCNYPKNLSTKFEDPIHHWKRLQTPSYQKHWKSRKKFENKRKISWIKRKSSEKPLETL